MKLGLIFAASSLVFFAASVNAIARADESPDPVHTTATFHAPTRTVQPNIPAPHAGHVQLCAVVKGDLVCSEPARALSGRANKAAK